MSSNQNKIKQISVFKRVFIPMCGLVGVVICIVVGVMIYYDVLGQLDENSQNIFNQQVTNRSHYLENEMISKWSNIATEVENIENILNQELDNNVSIKDIYTNSSTSQNLLSKISSPLITMLRNHGTTGVYLFFTNGEFDKETSKYYPGLYINDNDPTGASDINNTDLLLSRCPVSLVKTLNIPTASSWQPSFEFQPNDADLYASIFQNFQLAANSDEFSVTDVACWLKPYKIYGSDTYCISYVLPLIYDNQVYGAIGIDISFPHLKKILAYHELSQSETAGYVLAIQSSENTYQPQLVNGPYFSRMFDQSSELVVNQNTIENSIYTSIHELNLYNSNTPYEDEKWVLMGIIDKNELFAFTNQIRDVFLISILIVLAVGAVLSYMLSRFIAKPIVDLSHRISKTTNISTYNQLERTRVIEIDQLIEAIEKMRSTILESASRFTNIIQLANTKLAGFEIDFKDNALFVTNHFFDIFLLKNVDTKHMSIEQFAHILKLFDKNCQPTHNPNEYIYHIISDHNSVYLRLRYYETDDKCVGLVEEISDMIKERQIIEHERDHDVLTNLINRRAFQRKMKRLFTIDSSQLQIAALVMLDLDNLKSINDKYGHDCGDAYIKGASEIFKKYCPSQTIVSRTSGDEFYLFYYGYRYKEEINEQLRVLKDGIDKTVIMLPNHQNVRIHVSGGIAWYPYDSTSFDELQRYSDYAMYSVKRSVKGEIKAFNISDYENNSYISKKRIDYHQFIDDQMYVYFFQPIVNARTGDIFGYEALMRSSHPSLKDPTEIISLAKLEGQLNKIEDITWKYATLTYLEHYRENRVSHQSKLFVNSLSNQVLTQDTISFIERNAPEILDKIVLEVTEDEKNNETSFAGKQKTLLKWQAEVALDDYGSGYNSERNLLIVNPTYVKVDRDIIQDIDTDVDKQKIVENIVSYCHERGKFVIAEGVETINELKTVLYLDVDFIQGYYFAKPAQIPPQLHITALKALLSFRQKDKK